MPNNHYYQPIDMIKYNAKQEIDGLVRIRNNLNLLCSNLDNLDRINKKISSHYKDIDTSELKRQRKLIEDKINKNGLLYRNLFHFRNNYITISKTETHTREFSDDFKRELGYNYTTNIQCIESQQIKDVINIAIIEYFAYKLFYDTDEHNIQNLQNAPICPYNCLYIEKSNDILKWNDLLNKGGIGFVSLVKYITNSNHINSALIASDYLNIDFDKIYTVNNNANNQSLNSQYNLCISDIQIPGTIQIPSTSTDQLLLRHIDTINILGNGKQLLSAILFYQLIYYNNNYILSFPAIVEGNSLTFGVHFCQGNLINRDLIDDNINSTVLFCEDCRVALYFDKLLVNSKFNEKCRYVISGHYGTNLDEIIFDDILNHDVILLVAPNLSSLKKVENYKNKFKLHGAKSFRIFTYPIIFDGNQPWQRKSINNVFSDLENELLNNVHRTSEYSVKELISQIERLSMNYQQYMKWAGKYAITDEIIPNEQYSSPDFDFEDACPLTSHNSIDNVFPKGCVSIIAGGKNDGKSLLGMMLSRAISNNENFLFLDLIGHNEKILLYDVETPANVFDMRLKQFGIKQKAEFLEKICVRYISGKKQYDQRWVNINFENGTNTDFFCNYILRNHFSAVIIDNLYPCVSNPENSTTAKKVYEHIEELLNNNVRVIILHHLNIDETKTRIIGKTNLFGSKGLNFKCQGAVIEIVGTKFFNQCKNKLSFIDSFNNNDTIFGFAVRSSKAAYQIENNVYWYKLCSDNKSICCGCSDFNLSRIDNNFNCNKKINCDSNIFLNNDNIYDIKSININSDSNIDCLKSLAQKLKSFKRIDVQKNLEIGKTATCKLIQDGIKAGFIKKSVGKGPNTSYFYINNNSV